MTDHFQRLGLPRRFSVDPAAVEAAYLERSRACHPDFHSLASQEVQKASLEETAAINEAYLTIKDWYRRAEYLLSLYGGPTAYQEKNLDQEFLQEMLELREQIEEAAGQPDQLANIEANLLEREKQWAKIVAESFEQLEGRSTTEATAKASECVTIRKALNAVKTIRSLLRDLQTK